MLQFKKIGTNAILRNPGRLKTTAGPLISGHKGERLDKIARPLQSIQ
jgi:hypothetical protein